MFILQMSMSCPLAKQRTPLVVLFVFSNSNNRQNDDDDDDDDDRDDDDCYGKEMTTLSKPF